MRCKGWKLQVAMAATIVLAGAGSAGCSPARVSPIDTTLAGAVDDPTAFYSGLLADFVHDAHVDYRGLTKDKRLDAYIAWLATTDPAVAFPDQASRLAFWLNAYNAYTLKLIRDNYPVASINDLHTGGRVVGHVTHKTAWDIPFAVVGAHTYTLNQIEHDIIRSDFGDPRVHFALVCAARSCPPLRSEAYDGRRLDDQLDDQAERFFSQPASNSFDVATKTAHLSKILEWYRGDFADDDAGVLLAIARFLPDDARRSIEADPSAWKVEHTDYDWALNE